jgi:hypothetical protein
MSWRLAASLIQLRSQLDAAYPKRSKKHDGSIGDAAHAARKSDHNPNARGVVTAIDITHDPENGVDCNELATWLLAGKDRRIKYVIWRKRTFSSDIPPLWQWKPYTGSNPHDLHLHISVNVLGENDAIRWNYILYQSMAAVTASALNIRTWPLGEIIGTVPRGTLLQIVPIPEGWVRVKLFDGREGFVAEQFITRNIR